MRTTIVRAELKFKMPRGKLKINVNWLYYEMKAMLTPSVTSYQAYHKFFEYGETIIGSSFKELRYLDSISFYEGIKNDTSIIKERKNRTKTIKIVRDKDGSIVTFRVMP